LYVRNMLSPLKSNIVRIDGDFRISIPVLNSDAVLDTLPLNFEVPI
jgi:hypothetical protein